MGMNDNYTCLWKFRIKSTPIKCIGSALWYTSIRSHGGLWRSPQFVSVCCSIAELKLLTFFVSLLKRRPEEWLACRVFFEEVLCRVIQWDLNGVSLRATVSLSVTVGITIRCGSEVYLVAAMVVFQNPHLWWNEWGMCLRKCFIIIASRGSHPEKALLWPWQPGFAHHTQKKHSYPLCSLPFGRGCLCPDSHYFLLWKEEGGFQKNDLLPFVPSCAKQQGQACPPEFQLGDNLW